MRQSFLWQYPTGYARQSSMHDFTAHSFVNTLPAHTSHPSLPYLILLVFEAVLEVVCVSLPGYMAARSGIFPAEMQKFTANLNVTLFTPCLIFTKLASQLSVSKLPELAVIPVIFVMQLAVSYVSALLVARLCHLRTRPRNFVIAMGVFGNSNSLPISLVLSLSHTIKGLHWDRIENDSDGEVAARGILYLLVFQQLGQLLRWSWGYNILLAPVSQIEAASSEHDAQIEAEGNPIHHENQSLLNGTNDGPILPRHGATTAQTIKNYGTLASQGFVQDSPIAVQNGCSKITGQRSADDESINVSQNSSSDSDYYNKAASSQSFLSGLRCACTVIGQKTARLGSKVCFALWDFMNPPLWAMLAAIIVATIPRLQAFLFTPGTFINNSVTSAVAQSGEVAVPLILVVLGGNLARNTGTGTGAEGQTASLELRLVFASLISRMLLPILVLAPLIAVAAKFVPIAILDDPIFIIVCFLITGAPSALQLAQICEINNVFTGAMTRILFQSYVVWILPSTVLLVLCALEVVEWAQN